MTLQFLTINVISCYIVVCGFVWQWEYCQNGIFGGRRHHDKDDKLVDLRYPIVKQRPVFCSRNVVELVFFWIQNLQSHGTSQVQWPVVLAAMRHEQMILMELELKQLQIRPVTAKCYQKKKTFKVASMLQIDSTRLWISQHKDTREAVKTLWSSVPIWSCILLT